MPAALLGRFVNHPIITLLTDFGTRDHYVAAVKGVILRIVPQAQLVDITHEVSPQDVLAGALLLAEALPWFPDGTIHVAVVDPGVGTERRIIVACWGSQLIIAPDNGLITIADSVQPVQHVFEVTNPDFRLVEVSDTFHGRDIMAPTAALLACGRAPADVGSPIQDVVRLTLPPVKREGDRLFGEVIHIDRFGNLITNVTASDLEGVTPTAAHLAGRPIPWNTGSYAQQPPGTLLALIGSGRRLEIAVTSGSAHQLLNVRVGEVVEIS